MILLHIFSRPSISRFCLLFFFRPWLWLIFCLGLLLRILLFIPQGRQVNTVGILITPSIVLTRPKKGQLQYCLHNIYIRIFLLLADAPDRQFLILTSNLLFWVRWLCGSLLGINERLYDEEVVMVDVLLGTVMKILLCRFDQIILILLVLLIQHKLIPSLVNKHANFVKPKLKSVRLPTGNQRQSMKLHLRRNITNVESFNQLNFDVDCFMGRRRSLLVEELAFCQTFLRLIGSCELM